MIQLTREEQLILNSIKKIATEASESDDFMEVNLVEMLSLIAPERVEFPYYEIGKVASILSNIIESNKKYIENDNPEFEKTIKSVADSIPEMYLRWAAQQIKRKEPVSEVIYTINKFHELKQAIDIKDINKYESLGALRETIENRLLKRKQREAESDAHKLKGDDRKTKFEEIKNKQTLKSIDTSDCDLIYEDDDYICLLPKTKEASQRVGSGTRWCIAATQSRNWFINYAMYNNFIYMILTKDGSGEEMSKIAFCYELDSSGISLEIFNRKDENITVSKVREYIKNSSVIDAIYSDIATRKQTPMLEQVLNMSLPEIMAFCKSLSNEVTSDSDGELSDFLLRAKDIKGFADDKVRKYLRYNNFFEERGSELDLDSFPSKEQSLKDLNGFAYAAFIEEKPSHETYKYNSAQRKDQYIEHFNLDALAYYYFDVKRERIYYVNGEFENFVKGDDFEEEFSAFSGGRDFAMKADLVSDCIERLRFQYGLTSEDIDLLAAEMQNN